MRILFITEQMLNKSDVEEIVNSVFLSTFAEAPTVQSVIELYSATDYKTDLVICHYAGKSASLLKLLIASAKDTPFLFLLEDINLFSRPGVLEAPLLLAPVDVKNIHTELKERLLQLKEMGIQRDSREDKPEFTERLHETQAQILEKSEDIERLIEDPQMVDEDAQSLIEESMEVTQDLCMKLGFTPDLQSLVKKTVTLSLKLVGKKPNLSLIATHLRNNESRYISSHSFMLAEICCAIAHQLGWNSTNTFLKLTLAAFVHDMPMKKGKIARCQSIEEAKLVQDITPEELKVFSVHPLFAAEYSKRMSEIPQDVDVIVMQHHEQPDGTGFPRGLHAQRISPLSCVFIIAEDMLRFFLERPEDRKIASFIQERGEKYRVGNFKSVIKSLEKNMESL